MIGRQSSILVTNTDLEQLSALLLRRGDVRMLSDAPNESRTSLLPLASLAISAERSQATCYLAPLDWEPDIRLRIVSDVKIAVEVEESEAIQLWRSHLTETTIRFGRVFYTPAYSDRQGNLFRKDERYVKWAERTVAAIRRSLVNDKTLDAYVGEDAALRIASGDLTVIPRGR